MSKIDDAADRIAKSARVRSLVVLAGAGISISPPSNLPSGSSIVKCIVDVLSDRASEIGFELAEVVPRDDLLRVRLEVVLDILQSARFEPLRLRELFAGFNRVSPNPIHYFLAQLLKGQFVKAVVTTNYDDMIEMAYERLGQMGQGQSRSLTRVSGTRDINKLRARSYLLKIHGSLDTEPIGGVTQFATIPGRFVTTFQHLLKTYDLMVLGYSGNDDFSLRPLMLSTPSTRRVFWVDHLGPEHNDVMSMRTSPPREVVWSRDLRLEHAIPTSYLHRQISRNHSAVIVEDTSRFVVSLIAKLGLHHIVIDDPARTISPSSDIADRVKKEVTPEVAAICLIRLARRLADPIRLRGPVQQIVAHSTSRSRPLYDRAQLSLELAHICKAEGQHALAHGHFEEAYEGLRRLVKRQKGHRRALIKDVAQQIQITWGFSLKDDNQLERAREKFCQEIAPFGENPRARVEAPWISKDIASRLRRKAERTRNSDLLQEAKSQLERAIEEWRDLERQCSDPYVRAKACTNLSWAFLDLANQFTPVADRPQLWRKVVTYRNRAARLFKSIGSVEMYAEALRSGGMQRIQIATVCQATDAARRQAIQRSGFRYDKLINDAEFQIDEANKLFVALQATRQLVFTAVAKIHLAYVRRQFDLGRQLIEVVQEARKHAPLTKWEREHWIPGELQRLRKLKKVMQSLSE